jgi:hypothetical protein
MEGMLVIQSPDFECREHVSTELGIIFKGFGASENLVGLRTSLPRASLRLGDFSTEGPRHLSRTCVGFLYKYICIYIKSEQFWDDNGK